MRKIRWKELVIFSLLMLSESITMIAQNVRPSIEEKDYVGYLFAYFTGNKKAEESIHFAVSSNGYNYYALNKNEAVINSADISETGGVRDPHILRGEDGKTFYMVATDMVCANGWDSNRAMVLLKSTDLVNWKSTIINIQKKYAGQEDLKRVWAPQAIYDANAKKYLIYWSMKHGAGPDIIYYAYANKDFTDLEGEPKPLFIPSNKKSCIDGDIVYKDGVFHLFYKTEGHGNGIKKATTTSLTSGQWVENDSYLQQTTDAVEGAGTFKLNNSNDYILMYDVYMKGKYQFTKSSNLTNFSVIDHDVTMDFHPRHGTIMPVTRKELNALMGKWGKPADFNYSQSNPVLTGYFADPEVLYARKTGKYYIYPTSDGFTGWSGTYFKAFSSPDLKDWKDEGVILDLNKDVSWAKRNAWAPCIIEKKNWLGQYRYYYYFTAAQKIGVAVAKNPAGPFKDSGKPLVAEKPAGVKGGQVIDPDVFADPVSGKSYLYWGNGFMAVAELNKDMVSIKKETMKTIKVDRTFREGTYVFYRKGTYYFLWSEDDTRSPNYKVRYGMSKSPIGPLDIPANNVVITKAPEKGIYGTGHNSVVQAPDKDEWYIVYHRFPYPSGLSMGDAAGYHREVCIDKMEFNEDGTIKEVEPTF